MVKVTDDLIASVTDKFNSMAAGGKVEEKKIGDLFRAVGLNPTEGELAQWKKEVGGSCDLNKFLSVVKGKFEACTDNTEQIVDSFAVFDQEGEGYITAVEFKHILTTMGEGLSEKEMAEVMKEVDIDSKGMINYKTFADEIFEPIDG